MIKSELIAALINIIDFLDEKQIIDSVNLILKSMTDTLAQGGRIELRGFGSFSLHHRPPRNAHNPKTGKKVMTSTKRTPHFKPGKALKERINATKDRVKLNK